MSIKVNNITKLYGEQRALDDVSFEVNTGEIVGFLGPNGAGKSTTMKMITGYLEKDAGGIKINGTEVEVNAINTKKKIGYLPESNPLYLEMYVKEYLGFIADVHQISNSKKRIEEVIGLVGLTPESHKKISQLSKGYKQRVGLAAALIHDPEVLILDEPTSGLDPNQIIEIREVIKKLGEKKTILFSSHIMQEVESLCKRVIIINKGNIVANSTTAELQQQRKDEVVLLVEFKNEIKEADLKTIQGINRIEKISSNRFKIFSATDVQESVFKMAVQQNNIITTMQAEQQNLEDVFKQLTTQA